MDFEYSCFISYRQADSDLMGKFIDQLVSALKSEINVLLSNMPIYRDREMISGGTFYNDELEQALCKSVCMIVVYTPTYFHEKDTFCAREFKIMEQLECHRLEQFKDHKFCNRGLIIPLILRGMNSFPQKIKRRRHCYDFSRFTLSENPLKRHKRYCKIIKKIAEYIFDRHQELISNIACPCDACSAYHLPKDIEIRNWLKQFIPPPQLFPGR